MESQNRGNTYSVTLRNDTTNLSQTIRVRSDERIMDVAEQQGINLPYSCRAGACISCTGRLHNGAIDHDYCFLNAKEEAEGFILICTACPRSDCTIITHQEDTLLDLAERI